MIKNELATYWRIYLIAFGSIFATCGLVFYAMGIAYAERRALEINVGLALMIGGLLALVVGIYTYARRPDRDIDEPSISARQAQEKSSVHHDR